LGPCGIDPNPLSENPCGQCRAVLPLRLGYINRDGCVNKLAAIAEVVPIRILATEDGSRPSRSLTVDHARIVLAVASGCKVVGVAIYNVDYVRIAALAVQHVSAPAAFEVVVVATAVER
jgi:hypothetical protein